MDKEQKLIELISAQQEYIKLLGRVVGDYAGFSISHPHFAAKQEDIEHGQKCREKIASIETELGMPISVNL